ncbi:MAG: hypothetical protein ACOC0M_00510 [Halomonas sp.]
MGKARILSAEGEGRYTIEILEDRTRAESRKARNEQRIAEIDSELADLEQQLDDAQDEVETAAQEQDAAIAAYQADPTDELRRAMAAGAQAVLEAAQARDAVRVKVSQLNLERLTRLTQIDRVDALPDLRQQEAWCADYTEDLDGEVATAEVPGEIGQVIIQPGYEGSEVDAWPEGVQGGAVWSPENDGAIQPALSGTPASVFYNLAMMPGWQKWRPSFRIATISNIDEDLCDITLDPATSSQQDLNVNAQGSYSEVPIYYMDCNGAAFEDGDRVLVAFSGNTDQPMVVGFEREPKMCNFLVVVTITLITGFSVGQRWPNSLLGGAEPCNASVDLSGLTNWIMDDEIINVSDIKSYRYGDEEKALDFYERPSYANLELVNEVSKYGFDTYIDYEDRTWNYDSLIDNKNMSRLKQGSYECIEDNFQFNKTAYFDRYVWNHNHAIADENNSSMSDYFEEYYSPGNRIIPVTHSADIYNKGKTLTIKSTYKTYPIVIGHYYDEKAETGFDIGFRSVTPNGSVEVATRSFNLSGMPKVNGVSAKEFLGASILLPDEPDEIYDFRSEYFDYIKIAIRY